jgi:hypothetical protein
MTSVEFSKERRGQRLDAYLPDAYLAEYDLSVRHAWDLTKLWLRSAIKISSVVARNTVVIHTLPVS